MKTIVTIIMLSLGVTLSAQVNQNVTKETKTTKVTVSDGKDPKTVTKTETRNAKQDIELKDADSKKLNKDIQPSPVQVTATTSVSGDGMPTQINQTSFYTMNGERYQFVTDANGYKIASPSNVNYGMLRKTSNNNYIYTTGTTTSTGYFDGKGNFVVETYDKGTDGVTVETYTKTP
jgi:hypothetical protein